MKKILIISSNRLGDSILTSGLIEYYKKKNVMNLITFVCGNLPAEIFIYSKNIDVVIPLNKRRMSFHWFILWTKIFNNIWDEVIDLRGTGISYFLFTKKRIISPFFDKHKKKKFIRLYQFLSFLIVKPYNQK